MGFVLTFVFVRRHRSACWQTSRSAPRRRGADPEHLLLTRYNPERVTKGEMLGVDDVEEILAIRLLGDPGILGRAQGVEPGACR